MPSLVSIILGVALIMALFAIANRYEIKDQGARMVRWILILSGIWIVWWIVCACLWGAFAWLCAFLSYPIAAVITYLVATALVSRTIRTKTAK